MSTRALCLSVLCECELTADYQLSLEKVRIMLLDMKLMLTICSTVANFAAYTFAPPILVTPLGALSVIIGYTLHIDLCSPI